MFGTWSSAWLREDSAPTGERAERVIELAAMAERLERLIARDYIAVWLRKPVPALDDDKPLDVIGRGDPARRGHLGSGRPGRQLSRCQLT